MKTLNVTLIEPKLKHPTIIKLIDELMENDFIVIENDHDPKPLYYLLLAERGETFGWEYQIEGPELWAIKITKKSSHNEPTIGEIIAKDWRKAEILKKYRIDFCCGGKKTLQEVCTKNNLHYAEIKKELENNDFAQIQKNDQFNEWSINFLIDYIINNHHTYVKRSSIFIKEIVTKVASVHGTNHSELNLIKSHILILLDELEQHMNKEELILFPHIKEMVIAKAEKNKLPNSLFESIINPVSLMELEHTDAGENLGEIEKLSNQFTPPTDACTSYKTLYAKLKEFQNDLFQHIHLENNILFPKAIKLEKELLNY